MDLKFILFLCLTWGLQVSSSADGGQDGGYDAAAQLADRRTRYLEACDKMTSRLRPHTRKALMVGEGEWESAVIPKMKVDPVNGYAICAVNSIQFWDSLVFNTSMTALIKADPAGQTDGEEPDPEQQTTAKTLQIWSMFAQKTIKEKSEMLGKFKRVLVSMNPFDLVLNTFVARVGGNTIAGVSNTILESWPGSSKYKSSSDMIMQDHQGKPIATFRQFVNFLTKCSEESPGCFMIVNNGELEELEPAWLRCGPCREDSRYDYIISLHHFDEEFRQVAKEVGLEDDGTLPSLYESTSYTNLRKSHSLLRTYYSTVPKSEILDLYAKYRLEFELFGHSADEVLAMGIDDLDDNGAEPLHNF